MTFLLRHVKKKVCGGKRTGGNDRKREVMVLENEKMKGGKFAA